MSNNGLINSCSDSNCGWKCCSFGSKGHIVILPKELDGHEKEIGHLEIIDDNYFGGKKVICKAKDCKNCDNGYKPIMCRSYPLWVKNISKEMVFRSNKCPLSSLSLKEHKIYTLDMFKRYKSSLPNDINIDEFLSKVWIDRYSLFSVYGNNAVNETITVRCLTIKDLSDIDSLENTLSDYNICLKSSIEDIKKCLLSNCSYGLFVGDTLIAYSLSYYTEYGTGYIDKCFVRNEYRGNGYQYILLNMNIGSLISHNVYEIFAMVSPENIASIKSFKNAGFYVKRDTICNSYERYILKYEL